MANESNSSVVRVHKNTDFTIMSNHHLRNQKLSLKAIGLMSKILGLPCDWNYSIAGLVKICKEGETAVRAALHELIDERYVYLEKLPPNYSKSGRFEYVYHIYEIPYENIPDGLECPELFLKKQSETNQNADVPNTEKQDAENLSCQKSYQKRFCVPEKRRTGKLFSVGLVRAVVRTGRKIFHEENAGGLLF